MVKEGDVVYLWAHAYMRLIGRVTAVLGQRRVSLSDASILTEDSGGYEAVFSRGVHPTSTKTQYMGTIKDVVYLAAIDFPFALPKRKKQSD